MRRVWVLVVSAWAGACGPSVELGLDVDAASDGTDAAASPTSDAPMAVDAAPDFDAPPGCTDELCDDGFDDDCDGVIDDGCLCSPGQTQTCFTGPAGARHVGSCRDGVQTCTGGEAGEFGTWGPCTGDVAPGTETCDVIGFDEDCDGTANEGCECTPGGPPVACGTDEGACIAGTQECVDGVLGPCVGAIGPTTETCNGVDDDCDGLVDDGLVMTCGTSVGACEFGTTTCVGGLWQACEGAIDPAPETCNGIDDDCDGTTDEDLVQACGTDVGECTSGLSTCSGGVYGPCVGAIDPAVETCNGKDDDCDGTTDEDLVQACGTDVGECVAGTQTCVAGGWSACSGVGPAMETCDGKDNDCDGMTDEGCACADGATVPCGTDVGACVAGSQTCSGGMWGPCTGAIGPTAEVCENGADDDCDGTTDEGCGPPNVTCPPNVTTSPLTTVTLTGGGSDPDGGTVTFAWTVLTRPPGSTSTPSSPTSASTGFFVDLAGDYTLQLCVTDDEGMTSCCTVNITAIPPQDIHVELVWDTVYGDADLHMVQAGVGPAGYWYTSEADCFYGNTNAAWPPPGMAGNATLDIDDRDGYGPENINISTSPASGTYSIGVAYYCSHSLGAPGKPAPAPGDGPTTATVRIHCGGALVATYDGIALNKTGRFVDVARLTWPGCVGMSIMNYTWTALVQPAAYTAPLHCPLPCTNNADCGGGEVCTSPCPYTSTLPKCCTLAP